MNPRDYEYGRKLILSRLSNTQKLLRQTRPEQAKLRESLLNRLRVDREQLAAWDAQKPKPAPIDPDFYEEPCRRLDKAA